MKHFDELIPRLPDRHRAALLWFSENRGEEHTWPSPLSDGTLLASRAQGIYKPKWTKYCLSIRQSLSSRYTDQQLQMRPDGSWSLVYAEEASSPRSRDADYANRSLHACMRDGVPVGVMKQVRDRPVSRYRILGPAVIVGHYEGYFLVEGFARDGSTWGLISPEDLAPLARSQENAMALGGEFDPGSIVDARQKALASIIRRRGQPGFRQRLLDAYGASCAITGCDVAEALEAVHILPYRGPQTNHPSNGLLLRADVHVLFDLGLIAIDADTMTVVASPVLAGTSYAQLTGTSLRSPRVGALGPSRDALDQHRAWSRL